MAVFQFYALTFLAMATRSACYVLLGKKLHDGDKQTQPMPLWPLPRRLLATFGRRSRFLALLPTMLLAFALAAAASESRLARIAAAIAHTLFSMGCAYALEWGHGQYPVLYTAWALALAPTGSVLPAIAARGAVVYLYVCAGVAKLCVPARARDYFRPATMRALMSKDGVEPRFNPLTPALSRAIIAHDGAVRVITWATMVLELVAMPLTLIVPSLAYTRGVGVVCVVFHAGIWCTFSSTAGSMFFQLLGAYALGLCTEVHRSGGDTTALFDPLWAWALAAGLALSPLAKLAWRGDPWIAAECWPLTNCALFPWSAEQLSYVMAHLIRGRTRIVLLTRAEAEAHELVGRPVLSRGAPGAFMPCTRSSDEELKKLASSRGNTPGVCGMPCMPKLKLHNVHGNLWNWTKVYPTFVALLRIAVEGRAAEERERKVGVGTSDEGERLAALAAGIEEWLADDSPLLESSSGLPLCCARCVELDERTGLVKRVL